MASAYRSWCQITKAVFVVALLGLALLCGAIIMFSGFLNRGEGGKIFGPILCAGVYLVGSIFTLGERFSSQQMIGIGIFLNVLGAVFWVPTLGSRESIFGIVGIGLALLWAACIISRVMQRPGESMVETDQTFKPRPVRPKNPDDPC